METFRVWKTVAAPFDEANIDTNQLCPTRFNKVPRGTQHAQILFHDLRFRPDGSETDFILNRVPYRSAGIIVADRNFGCGSSRESAVWALAGFGIRSIIAPSFGDIFQINCAKNSVLPVILPPEACGAIRQQLERYVGAEIEVDLEAQVVRDVLGEEHHFQVHPLRRRSLLDGLDDIAVTEEFNDAIESFTDAYRRDFPWLHDDARPSA
jgi:3-isopropylmalate/(R)-2-methylmalate dehydratase small subunit